MHCCRLLIPFSFTSELAFLQFSFQFFTNFYRKSISTWQCKPVLIRLQEWSICLMASFVRHLPVALVGISCTFNVIDIAHTANIDNLNEARNFLVARKD